MEQVADQLSHPANIYHRAFASPNPHDSLLALSVPLEKVVNFQSFVNSLFANYSANILGFNDIVCNQQNCPIGTVSETYFSDANHLSVTGALRAVPKLKSYFESDQYQH